MDKDKTADNEDRDNNKPTAEPNKKSKLEKF